MQVTLETNSDRASSILDILQRIKGVKVTSVEATVQPKQEILEGIKQAVADVKLAREGKKLQARQEVPAWYYLANVSLPTFRRNGRALHGVPDGLAVPGVSHCAVCARVPRGGKEQKNK